MVLSIQSAKFKFPQYQLRANSPNLMLVKVSYPPYSILYKYLPMMFYYIHVQLVPRQKQTPVCPSPPPSWHSSSPVPSAAQRSARIHSTSQTTGDLNNVIENEL